MVQNRLYLEMTNLSPEERQEERGPEKCRMPRRRVPLLTQPRHELPPAWRAHSGRTELAKGHLHVRAHFHICLTPVKSPLLGKKKKKKTLFCLETFVLKLKNDCQRHSILKCFLFLLTLFLYTFTGWAQRNELADPALTPDTRPASNEVRGTAIGVCWPAFGPHDPVPTWRCFLTTSSLIPRCLWQAPVLQKQPVRTWMLRRLAILSTCGFNILHGTSVRSVQLYSDCLGRSFRSTLGPLFLNSKMKIWAWNFALRGHDLSWVY